MKWATVAIRDCKDTYAVLPKVLAGRWKAATREPWVLREGFGHRQPAVVRAVLPLSAIWHAGNAVHMMTRLAVTGARPGDAGLAHELGGSLPTTTRNGRARWML